MNQAEWVSLISYQLDRLTARNGHHDFERLALAYAQVAITPCLLPATGPVSSGGDQGRDFETFKTYVVKPSGGVPGRVAHAGEMVSFACSIQRSGLPAKIRSDIRKIMDPDPGHAGPSPGTVYFFAAAPVPVRSRHGLQAWARDEYRIDLQIIDGEALASQLAAPQLRWIAQTYFHLPEELPDPAASISSPGAGASAREQTRARPRLECAHQHILQKGFTGRTRERGELTQWWTDGVNPVRVIVAMGGMGKSSLAWVWMHEDLLGMPVVGGAMPSAGAEAICRVPEDARPDGILWWSFYAPEMEGPDSFPKWVDRALAHTNPGLAPPDEKEPLRNRVERLLAALERGRFLLVLDGFERAQRLYNPVAAAYKGDGTDGEVPRPLRGCTNSLAGEFLTSATTLRQTRLLLTSRCHPCELDDVAGADRFDLAILDPADSVRLFRTSGVDGSETEIRAACGMAGHHPLALRLLIGRVNAPGPHRGRIQAVQGYAVALDEHLEARRHHIFEIAYEGLSDLERDLLSRTAVFTQPIPYTALEAISPCGAAEDLSHGVDALEQRGFLSYDRGLCLYDMHPLVREYAYAHLSEDVRRASSARAYGYGMKRLLNQKADLGTLGVAIEVYRNAIHADLLREARDIYLHRLYPVVHFLLGLYQEEIGLVTDLVEAARRNPGLLSDAALGYVLTRLSTAHNLTGQPREGLRCALEADELLGSSDEGRDYGPNRQVYIASCEARVGDLEPATRRLEESAEAFRRRDDSFREAIAYTTLSWVLAYQGRFGESEARLDRAASIFASRSEAHWRCLVELNRVRLALAMNDPDRALGSARRVRELSRQSGFEGDHMRADWALGTALVRRAVSRGRGMDAMLAEADDHLRAALDGCRHEGFIDLIPDVHLARAEWHLARGDFEAAQRSASDARSLAEGAGYRLKQAEAHNLIARLEEQAGRAAEARAHAEIAYGLALCGGEPFCHMAVVSESRERLSRLPCAGTAQRTVR
ncbi:MAG: hypothetical protein ABW277_01280 [Longimicrobiaceae bacterium]